MLARRTEYAIRALVFISLQNRKGRIPLIPEICREIEAPQAFTAKILQTLSRQRLVSSLKGRGGGFFFDDENKDIRLYDVIYALQGDGLFVNCGFGLKNCSDINPCPLHEEYKIVRDNYYRIVKDETIASLSQKIFEGRAVLNNLNRVTNLKNRENGN